MKIRKASKAIVGAVVVLLSVVFAREVSLDPATEAALATLVGFGLIYLSPKNKD